MDKTNSFFNECYVMSQSDIELFADTLADGFSQYKLFKHICNDLYNHDKMKLFWAVSIALSKDNAICIADCKDANSVLIYIRPDYKEPGPWDYLRAGGLKMLLKLGLRMTFRLLKFDADAKKFAAKYQTANDGYLMAFATRLDKQGKHYGKPLIQALFRYLDTLGEGCYLETLKPENVGLYQHFGFDLKEQADLEYGNLQLFAMHRKPNSMTGNA